MTPRRSNLPCEWLSTKQCSTWEVKPAAWPFLSTFHCFDQFRTSYIYWYLIYFHISKYNLLLLYSLQPSLSDWVSLPLRIFSRWNGEVLFQALRGRCIKKVKKKLTSVSFMYVCVAGNGEMLVFFSPFFLQQMTIFHVRLGKKRKNVSFYRGVCMCKGKTNTC